MTKAFTLIETLVAITLLMMAIVVPMSMASQSLTATAYSRDEMVAYHLAEEAFETIRHQCDHNILHNALLSVGGTPVSLLDGVPVIDGTTLFWVDARNDAMSTVGCTSTTCPPVRTDGVLYGYDAGGGWSDTPFTRTVVAQYVDTLQNEMKVTVKVTWQTGSYTQRTFTISENLFRWVNDGSAST